MITTTTRASDPGHFTVDKTEVGTTVDLTGSWLFKPTSALAQGETPEKSADATGYLNVPVPQMLSRIQWWLDDSEDFKKWEQARLDKLGFDTEKSDDGWYRATIDVPLLPKDRRLWIEFDGVAMQCKAYLNGTLLGEHKGMFSRFGYDLTPHLKPGANVLAIWVSMEKIPKTSAQLGEAVTVNLSAAKVISMSKGMFGPLSVNQDNRAYDLYGIWQPVKLVVRGTAKIDDVFFHSSDNFQNTSVEVDSVSSAGEEITVTATYTDAKDGKHLAEMSQKLKSAGKDHVVLAPLHGGQVKPKLWTPADPNLYRLDVTVKNAAGNILDQSRHNVGFRTFEVKGNQFYLNGKPYWLRGANQLPYGKNPWDKELPRKLIQFMHDGNLRFTRTHATPWNENWLTAADEIGLAVSLEGIRPWAFAGKAADGKPTVMPPPEIFQHWLMENEDVIKRCRNHPSVFIFTVGNEMLLRDTKNVEKWKLMSEVTKQTRKLAPGHPIVVSSDYTRDPEFYESTLKPAGLDDGDIDDMHRYNGWYGDSTFVVDSKFEKELKNNAGKRPLMGQEFATGYPDLDSGLPCLRYTRDLITPQAWVGQLAYPGHDPAPWLAEHAKVTKRWAETLRFQRANNTSGFSLFSLECWFRHSYLPEATPYPIYESIKQAFAPVGVALETTQRRFFAGSSIDTKVFVTNDNEQFRDLADLEVKMQLIEPKNGEVIATGPAVAIASLKYYETASVPYSLKLPATPAENPPRFNLTLRTVVSSTKTKESWQTEDTVSIFRAPAAAPTSNPNVIVVKPTESLAGFAEGQPLRKQVEAGATAIVFSPTKEIVQLFPNDLQDVKTPDVGEYADFAPCAGTKLAQNLQPFDLKWWARKNDWRAFVATGSHRLKEGAPDHPARARELIRFIPAHSYIAKEKIPDQYRTVLSEIPLGKGRLWICNLAIFDSMEIDPAARLFADNLFAAAADPESTRTLPKVPTHEELLKGAP
jgi:hypothetical protein